MSIITPFDLRNEHEQKSSPLKRLGLAAAVLLGVGGYANLAAISYDRDSVKNAVAMCTGQGSKEKIEACATAAIVKDRGLLVLQEPVGFVSDQTVSDEIKAAVDRLLAGEKDLPGPGLVL